MRCLFDCFRSRDDYVSQPSQLKSKRGHDSKNRLSALFLSEEKAASSSCHDRDGSSLNSMHIDKGFKDEAQFIKARSTIPATPIEIRKVSKKLETPQVSQHFGSSLCHSWISSNSDAVFHLDEETNEPSEETGKSLLTSEQQTPSPSSCLTNARNSARISSAASEESIVSALRDEVDKTSKVSLKAGDITGKTKSVRSEFDFDQSYSSSSSKNSTSRKPEIAGTRIRSQFVHSTSNLNENGSLCKLPEDSNESLKQAKVQDFKEKTENESPTSTICEGNLEENSNEKYRTGETNSKEKSNKNMEALCITPGDRPIIGMVAAHWNEKEQSRISPKWWDGNGIPNSTNKYKEDQKVSWHATPFEERLEKALSEEGSKSLIPPRKLAIVEESERDTAISQLQHSSQSMSIVSF